MPASVERNEVSFRIWLVRCDEPHPAEWHLSPREGAVVEPASTGCFSRREAALYVRAFNEEMARESGGFWAVAVPVCVHYDGDLAPGMEIAMAQERVVSLAAQRDSKRGDPVCCDSNHSDATRDGAAA